MANITWTGHDHNGLFNDPANWSSGSVPGSGDTAIIDPAAAAAIGIDASLTIGALTMASDVTLTVDPDTALTIGTAGHAAAFSNAGTFVITSTNYQADLIVGASTLVLSGSGTVAMNDNPNNVIVGASTASELNNTDNLIEGAGQLGGGALTFVNGTAGVVDADDQVGLVLNTGAATIANSGLLEATGSGGLTIDSNVNNGIAGKIDAAGGDVSLQGDDIAGGTLTASSGGTLFTSNATLDGTAHELTIAGNLAITDDSTLTLLGTVANTGTMSMHASRGYGTTLNVGPSATPGTMTLTGSGTLTLSDDPDNTIAAGVAGDTFVNLNNVISGAGQIGNGGSLTIVNDATIDATGVNALVIDTATTLTNNKLLEATGRGGLVLDATIANARGTITAAGSVVTLQNADVAGGVLNASGGGYFVDNASLTLDGTAGLTNDNTIVAETNTNLTLLGTITNVGTIDMAANRGYGVNLYIGPSAGSASVTLTGSGSLLLSNDPHNQILAGGPGNTLVNLNNTISGAGTIGNGGSLTLINDATIDATDNNALVIDPSLQVTNNKLIEATGRGGLVLDGTFSNGTTGTIAAAGGPVTLQNADIIGGSLNASGLGYFNDNSSVTLDSSTDAITNDASIVIETNSNLTLLGTLSNAGTIQLAASRGYGTYLYVGPGAAVGTMTLTGSGAIVMSDDPNNEILANLAGDTLVNLNNTISGAGQIGNGGTLAVVNDATINASTNNALVIDSALAFTNNALLETTGSGGLVLESTIANGSSGTISAAGGTVTLSGATIQGGLLNASNGGSFVETASSTIDGSVNTVTSNGTLVVNNNTGLTLLGTLNNTGTLLLEAGVGYGTTLSVGPSATPGTFTLTGSGALTLSNDPNNVIAAGDAGDTLLNVNNTISGAGTIGTAGLNLVNDATIDANGTRSLVIDAPALTNNSLIESTGNGGVLLDGSVDNAGATISALTGAVGVEGTLENATGTIALGAGDLYLGGFPGQSAAYGTIEGGTLTASGSGSVVVTGSGGTLDGTANTLTSTANITVQNNTSLSVLGTISNAGTILLDSIRGYTADLYVGPGAAAGTMTLTGSGALTLSDDANNAIYANFAGDTLVNLNNTISGAGQIGNGGALAIVNDATIDATDINGLVIDTASTLTNNKLLEATGRGGLVLDATIANASGTISATGAVVTLQNADVAGGLLTASGGGYMVDNSALTLDGSAHTVTIKTAVLAESNTSLSLLGTISNAGTILLDASRGYGVDLYAGPGSGTGTTTLTGAGLLTLSDDPNNNILAADAGDTLVNLNNTIAGAGTIGNGGSLTVINDATIDATGNNALVIDPALLVTNKKLIEATGRGGLVLTGSFANGTTGTIAAAGGPVVLQGADIAGGILSHSGLGYFNDVSSATLDGSVNAVTNDSTVLVEANTNLTLLGTLSNAGTIQLAADRGYGAYLYVGPSAAAGTMTLTGSGTVTMSDDPNNQIVANFAGDTLVNLNNTISGAGTIGNGGSLTLINDGTINANGSYGLVINSAVPITNNGVMEATGGGGLTVDSSLTNAGTISVTAGIGGGALTFLGPLTNSGTIDAASGSASVSQTVSGTGTLDIGATGTLSLLDGAGAGQTADFLSTTGLLDLTNPLQFLGTIAGFGGSDVIDLVNTADSSWGFANGTLTVKDGNATVASLQFTGSYTQSDFALSSDQNGGLDVKFL